MDVKFSVKLNLQAVEQRLQSADERSTHDVSMQALRDCNYYCKQDQEGLINSSLIHSEPEKGILRWKTPYARRQYYLDAVRRGKNPNARKMWAHYAASVHGDNWLMAKQRAFARYAKGG